jgi:AraC family transcriptional regulator
MERRCTIGRMNEAATARSGEATIPPRISAPTTTESHLPNAYGDRMAKYFGLDNAPSVVIRSSKLQIAITRLTSSAGLPYRTSPIPSEKAFALSIHLTPEGQEGCENWEGDRYHRVMEWPVGGVGIYDLECSPRVRNCGPVDWVYYHVPRSTLETFTDEVEMSKVHTLRCSYGTIDAVLHQMTEMILPSLNGPPPFSELFLDYFCLLFCTHITKTYASSSAAIKAYRGGLAPWQKRRVVELVSEHLDGSLRLVTLAEECGLSVSHFARSFRRTFGRSAHQYLIEQRVEKAKALLSNSTCALSEAAVQAGFSDQAAFCRTFKAVVGTAPGHWRREANHQRSQVSTTPRRVFQAAAD